MGTMSKSQKEHNRINDEFDMIQEENRDFDISTHLAKIDDLPDLGQIELYDYDSDLTVASHKGLEVIESLVDLYLSEFGDLKTHPYIRNKVKEDAMVYAETLFLQKMTRKNFLTQLRQIDNGDNSARMHEIINQTIREIRENSKFSSSQRTELEEYYKKFREDLSEVATSLQKDAPQSNDDGQIVDNKKLNDLISEAMKRKRP
jgi:transposase-like protein